MKVGIVVALLVFGACTAHADDITLPLKDGDIIVRDAHFISKKWDRVVPGLSFTFRLQAAPLTAPITWNRMVLRFDIDYTCPPKSEHVSKVVSLKIGSLWSKGGEYFDMDIPLTGKVDACYDTSVAVKLLEAESDNFKLDLTSKEYIDLVEKRRIEAEQRAREQAERDAKWAENEAKRQAEEAEEARKAAIQAEKEAALKKKQAAERKKKEAIEAEENRRKAAEDAAKAAEEARKIRAACAAIFKGTADKKISDLTVREEQQVRACQALNLYPPQ